MTDTLNSISRSHSSLPVELYRGQPARRDPFMLKYESLDDAGTAKSFEVQVPVLRVESIFPGKDRGAVSCRGLRVASSQSFQYTKKNPLPSARVGQRSSWSASHSEEDAGNIQEGKLSGAISARQQSEVKDLGKCPSVAPEPIPATQNTKTVASPGPSVEDVLDYLFPPIQVSVPNPEQPGGSNINIKVISRSPGTRHDIAELESTLNRLLIEKHARLEPLCPVREALFSEAFDELTRQIAVECPERGYLLRRIRAETQMTLNTYEAIYRTACIASTWPADESISVEMPPDQSGDSDANRASRGGNCAPARFRKKVDMSPEGRCSSRTIAEGCVAQPVTEPDAESPPSGPYDPTMSSSTSQLAQKQHLQARKKELQCSVVSWKRKVELLRATTKKELEFAAKERQLEISGLETKIRLLETLLKGFRKVAE